MSHIYLGTLQLFVFPQIGGIEHEEGENFFEKCDGPPHLSHELLSALNVRIPNWWTGRGGPHEIQTSHHWIFFCGDL
jgi:hypothetical protein